MTPVEKLILPNGLQDDQFGDDPDLEGDTLVIGSPWHGTGASLTHAVVFTIRPFDAVDGGSTKDRTPSVD